MVRVGGFAAQQEIIEGFGIWVGRKFLAVRCGQLLLGKRFNLTLNSAAVPKDPRNYTVLGTSVPRLDIPTKTTGQFVYVQHVRLPGMLHGKVLRATAFEAKLASLDAAKVSTGVLRFVECTRCDAVFPFTADEIYVADGSTTALAACG